MSPAYQERMKIFDTCRQFEWEHAPECLVRIDKGAKPHHWVICMTATGFSSDGKFSKEASRVVTFRSQGLAEYIRRILDTMFGELYDC